MIIFITVAEIAVDTGQISRDLQQRALSGILTRFPIICRFQIENSSAVTIAKISPKQEDCLK
jgi:hypothetical protein